MASGVWLKAQPFLRTSATLVGQKEAARLRTDVVRCKLAVNGITMTSRRFHREKEPKTPSDVFSYYLNNSEKSEDAYELKDGSEKAGEKMMHMIERRKTYEQWLAHIMGQDPKTFGQKEIKKAIEYLMPSGLYAKDARPLLLDPMILQASHQAYMLDEKSRPLSAAFYTGRVHFHDLLFEIYEQAAKLNAVGNPDSLASHDEAAMELSEEEMREIMEEEGEDEVVEELVTSEDEMPETIDEMEKFSGVEEEESVVFGLKRDVDPIEELIQEKLRRRSRKDVFDPTDLDETEEKVKLKGPESKEEEETYNRPSRKVPLKWISKAELEKRLVDKLTAQELALGLKANNSVFEKCISHTGAVLYETIVHRLKNLSRHEHAHLAKDFLMQFLFPVEVPGLKAVKKQLNEQGEAYAMGYRKRAIAKVVVKKGTGSVAINDIPFTQYFPRLADRQQIMFPFLVVNAVGEYDVKCNVIGGGNTGQAGAMRLGISRALLHFEDSYAKPLQQAGLLIRDCRIKERKKPGQKKARKKFAWVRR